MEKHIHVQRRKQINLRLSDDEDAVVDGLRRQKTPIPSAAEVLREALLEKGERELKRGARR